MSLNSLISNTVVFLLLCLVIEPSYAQELNSRHDDVVNFTLSAEDWITTKSARVVLSVEASVSDKTAGSTRNEMMKSINEIAKEDWRLIGFERTQDRTGLERWSANFESRIPENELSGLAETAKKTSRAGLQVTVADIDFSPTLEEREAVISALRIKIYKQAAEQLSSLNSTLPGHNYRIGIIDFSQNPITARPMPMLAKGMLASMAPNPSPQELSEKVSVTAQITFSALAPK